MTKTNSASVNKTLKHFPPESHPWVGKITFSFGYPEQGWIQFAITSATFMQGVIVHLSNVFDPFPEFIRWLGDIADGNLPSEFVIDEEGEEKVFRSSPFNEDNFIFEILELLYGENRK